jgi:copper chaperone NosL
MEIPQEMNDSNSSRRSRRRVLGALVAVFGLAGCHEHGHADYAAIDFSRDTVCSLDGMTLADFPGPKAQIFVDGKSTPDFFCDTLEMFATWLKPEERRHIKAVFVQDMAQADWPEPRGHWIDARQAFYVAGSKRTGSMGATFASFATDADAKAFVAHSGGKVYRFDEVTPEMASIDGGVIKDRQME